LFSLNLQSLNKDIKYLTVYLSKNKFVLSKHPRCSFGAGKRKAEELSNDTIPQCMICLEPLVGNIADINCEHKFHNQCICDWYFAGGNSCPICRAPFRGMDRVCGVVTHQSGQPPAFADQLFVDQSDIITL
jgi:hypothetical protein